MVNAARACCHVFAALCCLGACSDACPTLATCDIRQSSCHEAVAEVVACLRDRPPVTPRVRVVDADRFVDDAVDDLEEDPYSEDTLDFYRGAALLSLMPKEIEPEALVRTRWGDVAAFYDPESRRVTVLDRGRPVDDEWAVILLAHELVHAAQHHEHRDGFYPPADDSVDAQLAAAAMTEGEATLFQDLATVLGFGVDPEEVDWPGTFADFRRDAWLGATQERSILARAYAHFSYSFGGKYLADAYARGGLSDVRVALRNVPGSTREVAAGYGARDPKAGWNESLLDVAQPVLMDPFEHVGTEHVGAWLAAIALERWRSDVDPGNYQFDAGVSGDSLSVFRYGSREVAVFWRLRFVSAERAEDAVHGLAADPTRTALLDRDLIVAAFSSDPPTELSLEALAWEPAPQPEPESEITESFGCRLAH